MLLTKYQIRVLFPFQWCCSSGSAFTDACDTVTSSNRGSWLHQHSNAKITKRARSDDYFTEYLPHVSEFLFSEVGESGCRYFQLDAAQIPRELSDGCAVYCKTLEPIKDAKERLQKPGRATARGLQLLSAATSDPVWKHNPPGAADPDVAEPEAQQRWRLPLQVQIVPEIGVELWFGKSGVGVLSVSLICTPHDTQTTTNSDEYYSGLVALTHALATAQKAIWFQNGVSTTISSAVDSTGEADNNGGWQHIHEWVRQLIKPINDSVAVEFDLRGVVYSSLELREPEEDAETFETKLRERLAHLAQIHPVSHPGDLENDHVQHLAMNQRHRTAVTAMAEWGFTPLATSRSQKQELVK